MKPTILLTLSFLLFAFTIDLPLAFSQNNEQVKDTSGNPIISGGYYYIKPATRGASGGGVSPGRTGNSTCPATVLQNYSNARNGTPVIFRIPGSSTPGRIIFTGRSVDITFSLSPICGESSNPKWLVVDGNDFPRTWVELGDDPFPGKGSFNIQHHGLAYKLVFCPTLTFPSGGCFDIGRYNDKSNGRRLVLADGDPYQVEFVNAESKHGRSVV